MEFEKVLSGYRIEGKNCQTQLLSSGLINTTWKVSTGAGEFILQRINTNVFKNPERIAANVEALGDYLKAFPEYLFAGPLQNNEGKTLAIGDDNTVFRVFRYIANSYTIERVEKAEQALEAAAQFGLFTFMLRDFACSKLQLTIPDFHNITFRYQQFILSTETGDPNRIQRASALIHELKSFSAIVDKFEKIKANTNFKIRVTHHDTKISNVLFDKNGKGLCVIDLDTVMPGYFFSDVGDMMRTYLSPTTEEESDYSKIQIREDIYQAIVNGYLRHMKDILTNDELANIFYSGTFMIYMQALRFATDFLNNDFYYGAKYPEHNFNRAANQLTLLKKLIDKEQTLRDL